MKKTNKRGIAKRILLIILSLIFLLVVIVMLNPLRRSQEAIKRSILKQTPISSSMEEVIEVIERKEWDVRYGDIDYNRGYTDRDTYEVVGVKSIRACIGSYSDFILFTTYVSVFWGFDEEGKLIDVYIWKDISSV